MKKTLEVINRMQADGVIGQYAIGGAVGATFYLEPVATYDLDIFISFKDIPPGALISLESIYSCLRPLGYNAEGEHLLIEGWKVQFLPASDLLHAEALDNALATELEDVPTRVMSAEHLMAIALRTGRTKDYLRIELFVSENAFDPQILENVLERHGLLEKWAEFCRRYLR